MSQINVTTIANAAGSSSVPSETVIAGSAKAWVNFNGTGTVAINDSFNVSSITDRGVGIYTINFTTPMDNIHYCGVFGRQPSGGASDTGFGNDKNLANTTSAFAIALYANSAYADDDWFSVAVFG